MFDIAEYSLMSFSMESLAGLVYPRATKAMQARAGARHRVEHRRGSNGAPQCHNLGGTMQFRPVVGFVAILAIAAFLLPASLSAQEKTEGMEMMKKMEMMDMPFGGEADVAFAEALWAEMDGYGDWAMQSEIMPGESPHGMFIRMYYSIVTIDGVAYHVVVKDNYGGKDVTIEMVKKSPADYLMAITPMVQREAGYDSDNNDWYWVKYAPSGMVAKNDMDMAMAGRVAKGMPMGCIACHASAGGSDYLFAND